jgi:hypothetical protein
MQHNNSISKSMILPRWLGGGDEAWFDKLTMTDYQLQACPEPADDANKGSA